MLFLFTKSDNIGSNLIQWGLDEGCSHFAMCFDETPDGYGIVLHSSLMGVSLAWFHDFIKTHQIVYCLKPKVTFDEEGAYRAIVDRFYGRPYDYKAFCYWVWRGLLRKYFGRKYPIQNKWGDQRDFLCTEIAKALQLSSCLCFDVGLQDVSDLGMISPFQLYKMMALSSSLEEIQWSLGSSS